ncbi:hypothetical protein [Desulfovibrio sp. TomC]|uniref:hypothetical protein n=1 Tax=Desulfovibrio sp. TomC TaxID=1562888 RepID=UPI0012E2102E|nr:hypothetical protein [Desulfovibrio sp. TomC]
METRTPDLLITKTQKLAHYIDFIDLSWLFTCSSVAASQQDNAARNEAFGYYFG